MDERHKNSRLIGAFLGYETPMLAENHPFSLFLVRIWQKSTLSPYVNIVKLDDFPLKLGFHTPKKDQ